MNYEVILNVTSDAKCTVQWFSKVWLENWFYHRQKKSEINAIENRGLNIYFLSLQEQFIRIMPRSNPFFIASPQHQQAVAELDELLQSEQLGFITRYMHDFTKLAKDGTTGSSLVCLGLWWMAFFGSWFLVLGMLMVSFTSIYFKCTRSIPSYTTAWSSPCKIASETIVIVHEVIWPKCWRLSRPLLLQPKRDIAHISSILIKEV